MLILVVLSVQVLAHSCGEMNYLVVFCPVTANKMFQAGFLKSHASDRKI